VNEQVEPTVRASEQYGDVVPLSMDSSAEIRKLVATARVADGAAGVSWRQATLSL